MNETAEKVEEATAEKAKKGQRPVEKVTMSDGRVVSFLGAQGDKKAQRFSKDALIRVNGDYKLFDDASPEELAKATPGDIAFRFDFYNGTTRTYPVNPALGLFYVKHGGLQKYGDELAGEKAEDLDDWAMTTDELDARVQAGDWTKTRVGGDLAGKSILVKALMAYTGRSAQEMQEHIKGWDKNARDQLSADPDIKVHIDRIRQEMADRGPKVDVAGLKAGLKKLAA